MYTYVRPSLTLLVCLHSSRAGSAFEIYFSLEMYLVIFFVVQI